MRRGNWFLACQWARHVQIKEGNQDKFAQQNNIQFWWWGCSSDDPQKCKATLD